MRKINEKISLKKTRKNFAKKIKIKPKKHENFAIKGRKLRKFRVPNLHFREISLRFRYIYFRETFRSLEFLAGL